MAPPRTQAVAKGAAPAAKVVKKKATTRSKAIKSTNTNKKGSDIFRLEDLPGEIRNHIYGFALAVNGPIQISRLVDQVASAKKRADQWDVWGVGSTKGQDRIYKISAIVKTKRGKAVRNLKIRDLIGLSLLRSSMNISAEARPLLYARNTFRFETPKAFYAFYACAHKAVGFLKDLEFVGIPFRSDILGPLANANRLSRVSLTVKADDLDGDVKERHMLSQIANLVLKCRCAVCEVSGRVKSGTKCIAATEQMQRSRFNVLSIRSKSSPIQVTDDEGSNPIGDPDHKKLVADRQQHQLNQIISRNVRIANGKALWDDCPNHSDLWYPADA